MPSTRSGARTNASESNGNKQNATSQTAGAKRKQSQRDQSKNAKSKKENVTEQQQQQLDIEKDTKESKPEESGSKDDAGVEEHPRKAAKVDDKESKPEPSSDKDLSKIDHLLQTYGRFPLSDFGLQEPEKPTPPTILAHLLHALLTSARISHGLATKSVKRLIEENYHDFETLKKSSWEERTKVLTEGGYTRYRERTATQLGELVELIEEKYGGDISKMRETAGDDPEKVGGLVKEVKGIGDVGCDIFRDTAQAVWPFLAPFIDPRNLDTAEELGLGKDVQTIWKNVGEDPAKMASICWALSTVRLEKKQDEFNEDEDGPNE